AFAATLVDEWARNGLSHAVVCPGSRSSPLALALAAHAAVDVHVRLDERSAAFTALGIGLATGRPAVVLTTSGTATTELHAAVVEADRAGVPLIACTADRPPELHDVGAPQTIDQARLFGLAVRWSCDPGVADEGGRRTWRSLASRVVAESTNGPGGPGPVHLNLPFREPLLGEASRAGGASPGRPGGAPWHAVLPGRLQAGEGSIAELAGAPGQRPARRGLVVAGAGSGDPTAVFALAEALGWPVLADPRSGLRGRHPAVVAAADGILRADRFAGAHRPDVVLHLGERWLSRTLNGFVSRATDAGARSIAVDPYGRWSGPERQVHTFIRADPTALCRQVVDSLDRSGPAGADRRWQEEWREADARAQQAIDRLLGIGSAAGSVPLCEPWLARRLVEQLPGDASLVVSSSMPVRDVEAYAGPRPDPPRVLSNRGANGIDGVVSTAIGVSLVAPGPTVALVGDLAFLHDVSALVGASGFGPDLVVVVADNRGGGIFSFLEVAGSLDHDRFDALFGTPQSPDVAEVAAGLGWPVDDIGSPDSAGFEDALRRRLAGRGPAVIRVRLPDRADNVATHRLVDEAVAAAVDGLPPGQQGRGS
ncbi:MAG: 2-succinyl-5-enolpyruvyl-6-hydroxy-3-cyclohexene-1-carboxylic-acid synthase, partial [Acidimicrobiales bacterium]